MSNGSVFLASAFQAQKKVRAKKTFSRDAFSPQSEEQSHRVQAMSPKISILLPVRDAEGTLRTALHSISRQRMRD
jgi:hypothetical protein